MAGSFGQDTLQGIYFENYEEDRSRYECEKGVVRMDL